MNSKKIIHSINLAIILLIQSNHLYSSFRNLKFYSFFTSSIEYIKALRYASSEEIYKNKLANKALDEFYQEPLADNCKEAKIDNFLTYLINNQKSSIDLAKEQSVSIIHPKKDNNKNQINTVNAINNLIARLNQIEQNNNTIQQNNLIIRIENNLIRHENERLRTRCVNLEDQIINTRNQVNNFILEQNNENTDQGFYVYPNFKSKNKKNDNYSWSKNPYVLGGENQLNINENDKKKILAQRVSKFLIQ